MKMKNYISKWLLISLCIIVFGSLILYFLISKSPRIEDLFINLAATVFGIIITLLLVDRSIKRSERKEWLEFEEIISNQITDTLFSLCNYMNLHSSIWKQWLEIFKNDSEKKIKINQFINVFQSADFDSSYINEIVKDDHLIDFFSGGYKDTYQKLDDLFRLFNNRLSAEQSIQVLNLRMNLSSLISNMSTFRSLYLINQEYNLPAGTSHVKDFLKNARETIHTAKTLLETI